MANNPTPITALTPGTPKLTDVYAAVDVTDTTQSPNGTTKQYTVQELSILIVDQLGFSSYPDCLVGTDVALTATYFNGPSNDGVNATLTNSGVQAPLTIDGVLMEATNIVLVKNQLNPAENGIYSVQNVGSISTNWTMVRVPYFNSSSNIKDNGAVFVDQGTINNQTFWQVEFTGAIVVGTTAILFVPLAFGNAAFKDVTDNTQPDVVSMNGAAVIGNLPEFSDVNGTIIDSGLPAGTAAGKNATDVSQPQVASVIGPVVVGHLASFADVNGTIQTSGTPVGAFLQVANNLSDVASVPTSRTNLGLGTAATFNSTDFLNTANNLSDVPNAAFARTNLGLGDAAVKAVSDNAQTTLPSLIGPFTVGHIATFADTNGTIQSGGTPVGAFLQIANNLSDVASVATSRTNLDVPQTNGTGATGTWPISITGTSGSIPNLTGDVTSVGTVTTYNNALPVALGGTGLISPTLNNIVLGNGALGLNTLVSGAANTLLTSSGPGVAPTFTTATFPSVATTAGTILRADGTNWLASTSTFADTYTINNILFASGVNTVSGLATASDGVLATNLTGTPSITSTLPSAVQANITTVGTITTGTWNGGIISGTYGGTGVNNGSNTITLGGNLVTSGAFATTLTVTGATNVTLPTSGTLVNNTEIGTAISENNILYSPLAELTTGLVLVSGTAYFVYLGRVPDAPTMNFVEFQVVTAGAGVQTAEVGLFSTPQAPNKSGQTLTRIIADGTITSLTSTGVKRNTAAFAQAITSGTHLWAGIRTAMATTQPSIAALTLDMSQGAILSTAASGALTAGGGTFVGSLIAATVTAQSPNLRISLI